MSDSTVSTMTPGGNASLPGVITWASALREPLDAPASKAMRHIKVNEKAKADGRRMVKLLPEVAQLLHPRMEGGSTGRRPGSRRKYVRIGVLSHQCSYVIKS
jgi:hypothetical protein